MVLGRKGEAERHEQGGDAKKAVMSDGDSATSVYNGRINIFIQPWSGQ